ncbi:MULTISPECIES: FadR/GntR family transcriptional regulator [unclassified Nocardioides]|uniref:FadR/GntR family transcriptional regulator n=1 Tax=unclassified Nocardioides TaxID=2615069 RepID=UPI0006F61673|nr:MULTISPECIES: FCD domain-containing protein [unclassified Nocardioides]KRA31245.1 GntR family transcriptional regulator [Nocardioides sp. Root614]KRA87866.1 GntR family transcriptional regulator [Nocardioides sp. Root682]
MARTALHDNVLDALGERIVSGALAAGTVLTLDVIDSEYDVSRSVSREAVRVLASMGMVASRQRVGVTVQPRTSWRVFDPRLIRWRLDSEDRVAQLRSLGELRSGFEPVAAGLAAVRATPEQCGALATAASDMVVHGRSGDLAAFLAADVLFHQLVLEASGNEMLAALDGVVAEVLTGRTHHHLMPAHPKDEAIDLHVEVARAVRSGDAVAARAAMAAIIEEATVAVTDGNTDVRTDADSGPESTNVG